LKAIVFDLDDTLYPERQFVASGFRAVAEWIQQHYTVQGFFEVQMVLFANGQRKKIFDSALVQCGLAVDEELVEHMLAVYRSHIPQITLFKDAEQALLGCREYYQTGVITDGYAATQRNKVRALALESWIDVFVFSDDYGRKNWKPSAVPYQEMCEQLNLAAKHCVYVGDNPTKDFVTAKKLGWRTLRVVRQDTEHSDSIVLPEYDAEVAISSLNALPDILRRLEF
jgi:putative hydrolase of the HAD superfamily